MLVKSSFEVFVKLFVSRYAIICDRMPARNMAAPDVTADFGAVEVVVADGACGHVRFLWVQIILEDDIATAVTATYAFGYRFLSVTQERFINNWP